MWISPFLFYDPSCIMEMMKKYKYFPTILVLFPFFVFAAGTLQYENPVNVGTLPELIRSILSVVVKIGIPIATVFIIYSGFLFVSANGNETQIAKAKKSLLWTLVGTMALLGAWFFSSGFQDVLHSIMG